MQSLISGIFAVLLIWMPEILSAQTDSALYRLLKQLPDDTILHFETYEKSGQLMHPDVCYINDSGKINIYLIGTPYPYYDNKNENPCLYISSYGLTFHEPVPGSNPLVYTPAYGHNDDPDIYYDSFSHNFIIHYLQTMQPDSQNIIILKGSPEKRWTEINNIHYNLKLNEKFIVSPSYVAVDSLTDALFYIDTPSGDRKKYRVEYMISVKNKAFEKNNFKEPAVKIPSRFKPWHIDVQAYQNKYFMILCGFWGKEPKWGKKNHNKYSVLYADSKNINEWNFSRMNQINCESIPDKHCKYIYRSTSLISGNITVIYYSFVTKDNIWKIGLKKIVTVPTVQ